MTTYAIADIHGRADLLESALERIEASPSGGVVVFLGDYVDRGEGSRAVLERLMAGPTKPGWKWVCLKGNHEDMMLGALNNEYDPAWWVGNGGGATLASYGGQVPDEHKTWLSRLPLYHCDGQRIFVHAGVDETLLMAEQDEKTLLWSRLPRRQNCTHPEGYIVHGHTPFEDGPIVLPGRINLDTGAVWTGTLAIAVFEDAAPGGPVEMMLITNPHPTRETA